MSTTPAPHAIARFPVGAQVEVRATLPVGIRPDDEFLYPWYIARVVAVAERSMTIRPTVEFDRDGNLVAHLDSDSQEAATWTLYDDDQACGDWTVTAA